MNDKACLEHELRHDGALRSDMPPASLRPPAVRARRSEPSAPAARPRARVLVVDDSAICLEATAIMLEDLGYAAIAVDSPFALAAMVAREAPDLVLVDVSTPGLSGDKLVEIVLRQRGEGRPAVIVLHSDRSDHELGALARSSGAAGYIRKTADADRFARELERYLTC